MSNMHSSINEALYNIVMEGVHDTLGSLMQDVEVKFDTQKCIEGLKRHLGNMKSMEKVVNIMELKGQMCHSKGLRRI